MYQLTKITIIVRDKDGESHTIIIIEYPIDNCKKITLYLDDIFYIEFLICDDNYNLVIEKLKQFSIIKIEPIDNSIGDSKLINVLKTIQS